MAPEGSPSPASGKGYTPLQRGRRSMAPEGGGRNRVGCSSMAQLQRGRRSMAPEGAHRGSSQRDRRGCFNGAGARWRRKAQEALGKAWRAEPLQRGRRSMAPEGPELRRRTKPGGGPLQRGRRSMAPEGARARVPHAARERASTGPALDGAGRRAGHRRRHRRCRRFNGAGARWRRKGATRSQVERPGPLLQRGRRSMAPEGLEDRRFVEHGAVASTGPALDGAGRGRDGRGLDAARGAASTGPALDGAGRARANRGRPP